MKRVVGNFVSQWITTGRASIPIGGLHHVLDEIHTLLHWHSENSSFDPPPSAIRTEFRDDFLSLLRTSATSLQLYEDGYDRLTPSSQFPCGGACQVRPQAWKAFMSTESYHYREAIAPELSERNFEELLLRDQERYLNVLDTKALAISAAFLYLCSATEAMTFGVAIGDVGFNAKHSTINACAIERLNRSQTYIDAAVSYLPEDTWIHAMRDELKRIRATLKASGEKVQSKRRAFLTSRNLCVICEDRLDFFSRLTRKDSHSECSIS